MKIQADFSKYPLYFKQEAGTSRGVLKSKISYLLKIYFSNEPSVFGVGECSIIPGLSPDDVSDLEPQLNNICQKISSIPLEVNQKWVNPDFVVPIYSNSLVPENLPAIRMGMETALLDLLNGGKRHIYKNAFSSGDKEIEINGLIWMGTKEYILNQVYEKLGQGFKCLKFKIGVLGFEEELAILKGIREKHPASELILRVDANGAFRPENVLDKLQQLAELEVESIEQPIAPGQHEAMARLCESSPLKIALDEDLIGVTDLDSKINLLANISPDYIVLKPSLVGGFQACKEWIEVAEAMRIGWWFTSALESNIGLNAISQFAASFDLKIPQGLGTGMLYMNNINSPLEVRHNKLVYNKNTAWEL